LNRGRLALSKSGKLTGAEAAPPVEALYFRGYNIIKKTITEAEELYVRGFTMEKRTAEADADAAPAEALYFRGYKIIKKAIADAEELYFRGYNII